MLSPHAHDEVAARKVTISASLALAIMIVDFAWLVRDEVRLVWPKLRVSWNARLYMLARYIGMSSQIYNVYFTVRMYHGVYTSPRGCRVWFIYQAVVVQFLLLFAEGLLMHRVYALFLHNRLILMMLVLFALCQIGSMGASARLSFPSNKHTVTCLMVNGNPGNALFSATTMTTNLIIFFMTFWRYFRLPAKWTRQGIGKIVFRDSALSLSAISVMMLFLTLCSLQVIKPSMSGNITYYWLVCILWVSIGRTIVNYEKSPRSDDDQGEGSIWKETLQLTSQIEMGESTISVDTQSGSSGRTPTLRTLQTSFSPMIKACQASPLSAHPSESSRKWFGSCSPTDGDGHQCSPGPPSTEVSVSVSIPQHSPSHVSPSDGDDRQTVDQPRVDADAEECVDSPASSPQPLTSEPPPSEASS